MRILKLYCNIARACLLNRYSVVKADFPVSFNDSMRLLATLLKILPRPYPPCNTRPR